MIVGILGLGLIGGSLARAYSKNGHTVYASELNENMLEFAQLAGVVHGSLNGNSISKCNLILLAVYAGGSAHWLNENSCNIQKDCLVIDCCGIKDDICKCGFALADKYGFTFIGGHPMAGSEKSGFVNSKAMLIENAYYIITPTAIVAKEKVDAYAAFVESLKALPVVLDY